MNIEDKIKVMQAFAKGKKIQYKNPSTGHQWLFVPGSPTWNWQLNDYRVVAEPRVVWVVYHNNEGRHYFYSEKGAKDFAKNFANVNNPEVVKFVEEVYHQ